MLKGWDRIRLRGTLRSIAHCEGLSRFLSVTKRMLKGFGKFAEESSHEVREAALAAAEREECHKEYLYNPGVNKEQLAREIARRDGITQGLICVLSAVEPCWGFQLDTDRTRGELQLRKAYRKGLHVYHYYLHPIFGFMHVRLDTWLPFDLHICINGREWLARQMEQAGIESLRKENCFLWTSDMAGAQKLLDKQVRFKWGPKLDQLAQAINPLMPSLLAPYDMQYYWSMEESEWATDFMFRSTAQLSQLYPSLIRHGMESLGSRDVMRFLGQRVPLHGNSHRRDCREIVTDIKQRQEGIRIKHRLQHNSVKMYNKQGSVLRVETTLNNMRELKSPRCEKGKIVWKQLRKGIADARQRAKLSDAANERYLDAMACVGTPTPLKTLTESLSRPATLQGRRVRGLNLLGEQDAKLLQVVGRGEFLISGFRNRDLQTALYPQPAADPAEKRRLSGKVTRQLRMLRAHRLIKKLSHTHRYIMTHKGRQLVTALMAAREADVAKLAKAA
jgi:hypothetical protein